MKKILWLVLAIVLAGMLFFDKSALAYQLDRERLIQEFADANYTFLGEVNYYGVPCLKIVLPMGQAIYQVCRRTPLLNAHYFEAREAIAVLNGLHYAYPRGSEGQPNQMGRETILIPLDTSVQPKAFPEFESRLAKFPDSLVISIEKQLMAYYRSGYLSACFPVSTARAEGNKKTPKMKGWAKREEVDHWSTIYNVLMPYSIRLSGFYLLHGGVMPGDPDSAGCVRMFTEHIKWLYYGEWDRIWYEII